MISVVSSHETHSSFVVAVISPVPAFILLSILFPFEDLSITGCGTGSLAEVPQNPFYLQTSYLSGTLLLNEPSPINGLFDIDLWFLEVIGLMGLCGFWLHFICN